ncbi:hypothetical protein LOZ53_003742 [Ophidiomyces ophidiicola]|nr:hypothetical protein LOZ55_005404 [Ophidiomyces ophidiicola]KAI1984871.1 hypothetical protein LOZ54_004381 [Ophidiomyces ophidiicola]KAI1986754.1 hypothetical protein LOZ51_005914 [Ophidiomyces ophidiicola]KAI1989065.1 hypothetical protein LOZ53_003742 [Ophidiomyces ophidiicola]
MAAISVAEFRATLRAAIDHRKTQYANFYAFHFRWEDDNTGADQDKKSFCDMTHLMGFPNPDVFVIPKDMATPGLEVMAKIIDLFKAGATASGQSILLVHYSGHGGPNNLDELVLSSRSGQKIAAEQIMGSIINTGDPDVTGIDVVFIFDCCYSFLTTRTVTEEPRIVEVLAASNNNDPAVFGAGPRNSFTSKMFIEIHSQAQAEATSVEMADVIDTLQNQSSLKKPGHATRLGVGSVVLPLLPNRAGIINNPNPSESGMLATFSIHVGKIFTKAELEDLGAWLASMPKVKGASLRLESIKQTQSTVFIFEASRLSYHRIRGLPGVTLICENFLVNFDWFFQPAPPQTTTPSQSGRPIRTVDENIPPEGQRTKPSFPKRK